jgi:hypothetical protein
MNYEGKDCVNVFYSDGPPAQRFACARVTEEILTEDPPPSSDKNNEDLILVFYCDRLFFR